MKKSLWIAFAASCILIGLYPLVFLRADRNFSILALKTDELLASAVWWAGFLAHIGFGGLALIIGWTQFSKKWRAKYPALHRNIGKVYVVAATLSGLGAISISMDATGGFIAQSGFIAMGITWLATTLLAFTSIRQGDVLRHQKLMIYSYAVCFGAVTLRIYLPPLVFAFDKDFAPAYRIVAWLSWLPNMAVAWWLVRRMGPGKA